MGASGIDPKLIVDYLMKVEATKLNKLTTNKTDLTTKKEQFGQLNTYVLNMQKSIENVKSAFKTPAYKVAIDDSTIFGAKITNNNQVYSATHTVVIDKLAKADTWRSASTFTTRDSALSFSGGLSFTTGSDNFSIAVATDDSLNTIRDKINNSSSNYGLTASIVSSTVGGNPAYSLLISSSKVGADNAVTIGGTAASSLNLTSHLSTARNAEFTIDGQSVIRSTNEITDVVDGISFSLLKEGTTAFTISASQTDRNAAVTKAIQDMLSSYNQVLSYIGASMAPKKVSEPIPATPNLANPDQEERTRDRWVSNNDDSMSRIRDRVINLFNKSFSEEFTGVGDLTSLSALGIKTSKPLTLTLAENDSGKNGKDGKAVTEKMQYVVAGLKEIDTQEYSGLTALNKLLTEHPEKVEKFFTDPTGGFIAAAKKLSSSISEGAGTIYLKQISLDERVNQVERAMHSEQERLDLLQPILLRKYADLAGMMEKFNSISSQLQTQFSNMGSFSKK